MKTYQLFVLFAIGCTFLSCSKSVYYAWSSSKGDYCTLEVKKHEVIYRASASCYLVNDDIYIYIKDAKSKYSPIDNRSNNIFEIDFNNLVEMFKLSMPGLQKERLVPSRDVLVVGFDLFNKNGEYRYILYAKSENQDTIYLKPSDIIERYDNWSYVNDPLLQKHGITWFPNEMYYVKKIDYKKFPEPIQKMKLKNPH